MIPAEPPRSAHLCPPWCNGEHEISDDLRVSHRNDGIVVPGVERVVNDRGGVDAPTVVQISIGLEQTGGETWVWIGPEESVRRSTILSLESAKRLVRQLQGLLDNLA